MASVNGTRIVRTKGSATGTRSVTTMTATTSAHGIDLTRIADNKTWHDIDEGEAIASPFSVYFTPPPFG